MALRPFLVLLTVCSCVLAYYLPRPASPVQCLQFLAGAECLCGDVDWEFQVFCSCRPVKTLDLRNLSQDYRVSKAAAFHLNDCGKTSVLVFPRAFSQLNLKSVTFYNISSLTLEPYSIHLNPEVKDAFNITFSLITTLSIRKDAVNVQLHHPHAGMNLKIRHASLISLMKSAIVGKLRELTMEEMLVKARPWPGAVVCQGLTGASVIMKSVLIKKGLSSRWITGNISSLSISKSSLRLLPDAFAGVNIEAGSKSKTRIVLLGNNFMIPSLPSHALPSHGYLSQAKQNYIVCQCQNLAWLLESPSTQVKQSVKASLICRNNKSISSVLASCEKPCTVKDCKQNP
ncbi:hypothetical protein GWK47_020953 [Chionoecetes opilio]|uniref:Uncharacterized protein n=1 Tax=Chionoecetes opilio TaxID=41210 RepID=A0A8J5CEP6_CHIOP|nr:hypothetical protein GWK47_020953 [Chionoecetes opilio]